MSGHVQPLSLSVVPCSRVVHARDEASAVALLVGCGVSPAEARRMATGVLEGRLLLVRGEERIEQDEFADVVADVPLLTSVAANGGRP